MSKLPATLYSFPKEYYALIDYAKKRMENKEKGIITAEHILIALRTQEEATSFRHKLNSLRKSLAFWRPTDERNEFLARVKFVYAGPRGSMEAKSVKIIWREVGSAIFSVQLPGFDEVLNKAEIPEATIKTPEPLPASNSNPRHIPHLSEAERGVLEQAYNPKLGPDAVRDDPVIVDPKPGIDPYEAMKSFVAGPAPIPRNFESDEELDN